MLKKEVAVQLMKHLVEHNWHGYSQVSRWGDGEGTCDVNIGGKVYKLQQGDRDCSSAVIDAYQTAGIDCGGATYTGNMRRCMTGTGNFKWHTMSSGYIAQAGDIYLNEVNHTAMCLSAVPDMLMEFSISETGGIDGAEGDQTGRESLTRAYYNYPWDGILECINKEQVSGATVTTQSTKTAPAQVAGKSTNNLGLYYRAHVENLGWLAPVHDGQVAGTTGHGLRLEALKIDTRKLPDVKIKASAHIQGTGTVDYGYITHETVIGTTGQKKRLEALMLEVEGLPEGKKLYVQMHFDKTGWGAVVPSDGGSFGLGKETQAIKMWIE